MVRSALLLTLLIPTALPGNARAQFPDSPKYDYYPRIVYAPIGYQFYGWSGWGAPPQIQAEIARGMGLYAQNAAQAQRHSAELKAQAQRQELVRRWNTFLWSAEHAYLLAQLKGPDGNNRDLAAREPELARLRDRPTPDEIHSGAALNALLNQLTDPRLAAGSMRLPRAPINPKLISEIPFEYASEVIAILLQRLTADPVWPPVLAAPALAPQRKALRAAIDAAAEEDRAGSLSEAKLREVHRTLHELVVRAGSLIPRTSPGYRLADGYLKALTGLARLLGQPDLNDVVAAAGKQPECSLDDLLGFMQIFNLRFGPATTDDASTAYDAIYRLMLRRREDLRRHLGARMPSGGLPLLNQVVPALMVFTAMSWEQLTGVSTPAQPAPRRGR